MLVDSSVWIDFLRGGRTRASLMLQQALQDRASVSTATPIVQEVLQGARDAAHFARLAAMFGSWEIGGVAAAFAVLRVLAPADPRGATIEAARLFARARWRGWTIRASNDCLIAVLAIEHHVPLLTLDADFRRLQMLAPRLRIIDP